MRSIKFSSKFKHNKIIIIPLIIAFFLVLFSYGYTERHFLAGYEQNLFNHENGLPANEANCVIQSSDGYIWVGTYSGLLRYDGNTFTNIKNENSSLIVRKLFEDSKQKLWIGTNDQGVLSYEKEKFQFCTKNSPFLSNSIRDIIEDQSGNLIVASTAGIAKILPDGTVNQIPIKELEALFVLSLFCDADGTVWGVAHNGAVFAFKDDVLLHFFTADFFNGANCMSVFQMQDGTICLGTRENKLILLEKNSDRYISKEISTNNRSVINNIFQDNMRRLWICADDGVGYFDQNLVFHDLEGLRLDNAVDSMYEDYEGNLWITSSRQGLLQLVKKKFTDVSFIANLDQAVVNATCMYNNQLYIGTDTGLIVLDRNYQRIENALADSLTNVRIRNLYVDRENRLWVSSYGEYGAICYQDGKIINFNEKNGLSNSKVRTILERSNGDIVIGTGNGINIIRDGKIIKKWTDQDGINNALILCLYEDQDGNLYAGTDGSGIYVIHDDYIEQYNEKDGLTSGVILRIQGSAESKRLWISAGNGLCYWDSTGIQQVKDIAFDANNIFDIKMMPNNEMWILKGNGIYITTEEELLNSETKKVKFLGKNDGLNSTITANSQNYLDENETLYLACNQGVQRINVKEVEDNLIPPKVAIQRLTVRDDNGKTKSYESPAYITLEDDCTQISINLAVLSFANNSNQIEYFLEGVDKQPIRLDNGAYPSVSYTNLKGGDYTFHLRAINNDGIASEKEAIIYIHKKLGLLEQPLVQIFLVLLVLSLFWFYAKAKIRVAMKQKAQYKEITNQSIMAIANTIDAKDKYTNGHSKRVARYAVEIAKRMNLAEEELESLYYTALLHDIGKIGIPDNVLNKPGRLNDAEYEMIKKHTTIGYDILKEITMIDHIADGANYHHERYDGKGYNNGLKGQEIPLAARIICVADAFDAMYSKRSYRNNLAKDYILDELEQCAGKQFDPQIAKIMIDMIKDGFVDRTEF